jgi:hypothetical protein
MFFFSNFFFFLALLVHLHQVVDLSGADAAKMHAPSVLPAPQSWPAISQ